MPVALFPESLASSVTTTVWVGVMVAVFFTLRFGWNLSGLVVPGYMTPLLLVKPLSAAVVFTEGVITYLLVHGFSERCSRYGVWSSLFGRDRFFGLVLVSVAVRLVGDGWLWPAVGELWSDYFRTDFDYRGELHSFGLIVVSLIANQFWKTGVRGGWIPVCATVGLTYLIVRYGLMEFTNFSIANLSYAYNDLAASLLAAPKAYIVLLTTAFLASRMNLYYGWEFNGILIPSLLALQWYQPTKILTSFLEAFLVLGMARLLFRVPAVAGLHLEGPRQLLFFFNLGFCYKLALGWLLPLVWPTAPVGDAYGFGYLLTTLIAMRMHDKEIIARLTRATLQTSLVAVGVASVVGFALALLSEHRPWLEQPAVGTGVIVRSASRSLSELLNDDSVRLRRFWLQAGTPVPLPMELAAFEAGIEQLRAYLGGDRTALDRAAERLAAARYRIDWVERRYLYLHEEEPARGWGFYVLDTHAADNLVIEVPAPLDERGALAAAGGLFGALKGRVLAVAGAQRAINPNGSLDVLRSRDTLFQRFHQVMARRDVLQVRAYTARSSEELAGVPAEAFQAGTMSPPTTLWVRASLPPSLNLARLRGLIDELPVNWASTPSANLQRATSEDGFAELVLNRTDLRRLRLSDRIVPQAEATLQVGDIRIDGYLREWLLADKQRLAGRGTDRYRPPRLEDLLYFDEEVLTPLLGLSRSARPNGEWSAAGLVELRALAIAARGVGYDLLRYRHRASGQEYLILTEDEASSERRYWGTYVFRLAGGQNYLVAVPHPLFEINSFEYGVSLFERMQANVLSLAGAHPQANRDGTADVTVAANANSLFTLVGQVVLREAGDAPWLMVSVRAYGVRPGIPAPTADAVLAWGDGAVRPDSLGPLEQQLLAALNEDGLSTRFVDGAPETAGYEAAGSPQARYLSATANKAFCTVWLSPRVRAALSQQGENAAQEIQFATLGIPTRQDDLYRYLASLPTAVEGTPPPAWREAARAYIERRDILNLRQLRDWPGFRYERLIDRDTQQAFLLALDAAGRPRLAVNLRPRQPDAEVVAGMPPQAAEVERFKNAQAGWLLFGTP